jgi:hypothetical protein
MSLTKVINWTSIGLGAVVMAFVEMSNSVPIRPRADAEAQAAEQSAGGAPARGVLEGIATLGCAHSAIDCRDRPYNVGLFIRGEQEGLPPLQVYASPRFSIAVVAGTYTIGSADVRSSCCLPTLQPITVKVVAKQTTHVTVRFTPGSELPTR